nr:unnamed protein product [Digitaria exilis]
MPEPFRTMEVCLAGGTSDGDADETGAEEERLRHALLAVAPDFLIRRFAPGSFLVLFTSPCAMDVAGTTSLAMPPAVEATQLAQEVVLVANPSTERLPAAPMVSYSELVAFEEQCPVRSGHESQTTDPMLFEISAPMPKPTQQTTNTQDGNGGLQQKTTTTTVLKTYQRRARIAAAQSSDDRAALPPPTTLRGGSASGPPCEPTSTMILAQQDEVATTPTLECAKTTPNNLQVEEAKARTAAFLASVSQALQRPLADLPFRRDACTRMPAPPTPAPTLHRSDRLASQPLNSMVRASRRVRCFCRANWA